MPFWLNIALHVLAGCAVGGFIGASEVSRKWGSVLLGVAALIALCLIL